MTYDTYIFPSHFKRVAPRVEKKYSPVELVKEYGDAWAVMMPASNGVSSATKCAMFNPGPDLDDFLAMCRMERGLQPRIWR